MNESRQPRQWKVGDRVRVDRIDFDGEVVRVVPTPDPVVVLRASGGAELTMRGSDLAREARCS